MDHAAEQAAGLLATKGYFNSRIVIVDDHTGKTVGTDAQLSAGQAAEAEDTLFALLNPRRIIYWWEGPWRVGVEARSSWLYRSLRRLRMGTG